MTLSLLRDRIAEEILQPGILTSQQRNIVEHGGNMLVLACPGSGKTRTAGYRVARLIGENGDDYPVAATSYTNVAVAEIKRICGGLSAGTTSPHFIGTLHSLLLSFVFRPFARMTMGCATKPMFVPTGQQNLVPIGDIVLSPKERIPLWNFTFSENGNVEVLRMPHTVKRDPSDVVDRYEDEIREKKAKQFTTGIASFNDAMYLSMRTLEDNPDLAKSLARRFGEILVDEAQDTSTVQLRALEEIAKSGVLRSLVVIGDPNQAVYEWMGANPDAFNDFRKKVPLEVLELTENFRSSQAICDVTWRFSESTEPDTAQGTFRDLGVPPELLVYPANKVDELVGEVEPRLTSLDLELADAVFLTRGGTLARKLRHVKNPDAPPSMKALAKAKSEFEQGDLSLESLCALEALLSRLAWDVPALDQLDDGQRIGLRDSAFSLARALPDLSGSGGDWIREARDRVTTALGSLAEPSARRPGDVLKATAKAKKVKMESFRGSGAERIQARTIHSAKGETHAATILVADAPGKFDNARTWAGRLAGEATSEESRLIYVALTRPQKYCAVALTDKTPDDVLDLFVAAGFVR